MYGQCRLQLSKDCMVTVCMKAGVLVTILLLMTRQVWVRLVPLISSS